jgi:YD repeat-containing protein
MLMRKLLMLTGALAVLGLSACKKENSQQTPGGGGSAKRLKKITKTENNETTVYNFIYDGNQRLTAIRSTDNKEETLFTYDAAGNLTGVQETETGFKNKYTYTYQNGIPVSGTFKSWELTAGEPDGLVEDDLLTYTVTGGQVSKIHLDMTLAGEEMDFNLGYTNGNLTQAASVGADVYKAVFTYGNKKPLFPTLSKYVLDQAGFSLQFFAKNELLSASYDFPGTFLDKTVVNQYTYDAAGYALSSNDGETQMQFVYE